jgi:competence protein ComEA
VRLRRDTPPADPGARQRALHRLAAATGREPVTGGWTPSRPGDEDDVPPDSPVREQLRGSRWSLAPRHLVVLALVLVAGVGWAGCSLLRARPQPVPDRPVAGITSGTPVATPGSSPSAAPRVVVVHVAGRVRRPGLVRAAPGARVADVIASAGGALPGADLTSVNLARQVTDGEQIVVGVPGARPPTASPGAGPSTGGAGGQVDLNTASLAQLEGLPGVGPVLAQRILDWRTEHGRFSSVDELQEVSGVGPKKFESLKPHVRV